MSEKQKLTLTVDKDVIEKAKKMNINISGLTEDILRVLTYKPKKVETEETLEKYKELLNFMLKVMNVTKFNVIVGGVDVFGKDDKGEMEYFGRKDFYLRPLGKMFIQSQDPDKDYEYVCDLKDLDLNTLKTQKIELQNPKWILDDFIDNWANETRDNKKIHELEMVRKIIQVMLEYQNKRL